MNYTDHEMAEVILLDLNVFRDKYANLRVPHARTFSKIA